MKHSNLSVFLLLASSIACSSEPSTFRGDTATKTVTKTANAIADALPDAPTPSEVPETEEANSILDPISDITLDPAGEIHELTPASPALVPPPPAIPEVAALPEEELPPAPPAPPAPPPVIPVVVKAPEITLEVQLSGTEVREGGKTLQALALLTGTSDTDVVWSLEGAAGGDLGSIDATGKYTSPGSVATMVSVNIIATLVSDNKITAKKSVNIIPVEQLFVGCTKGGVQFPITADVYQLPANTAKLPNFSTMTKSDVVCLDKFDIPLQSWELGFPGASNLQEWFALHTASKLIIPSEGTYSFMITSDDGSNVYLNGSKLIDNDGTHSAKSVSATITLAAGKHDLVLDWYQGPRTHIALQFFWKTPGSNTWVIVPSSAFAAK